MNEITVIITAYNCAPYLAEAIDSVLNQLLKADEIIVIDDGSNDGGGEVIKAYADKVRYLSQENAGIGAARNSGIKLAKTDLIAFLDGDDIWPENKLAVQTAALHSDPDLVMVFGYMKNFHSPELSAEEKANATGPMQAIPGYCASTMLLKQTVFEQVGLFRDDIKLGEFIDWYLKSQDAGFKHLMLDKLLLHRRLHKSNQGIRHRDAQQDYVRIVKAALDRRRKQAG